MIELKILMVLMIVAAIVTVELKDLLGAIVSLGAIGLLLSITFVILQAPELGIVQLIVEILALIILIRMVGAKCFIPSREKNIFSLGLIVFFLFLFLFFSAKVLRQLPAFGNPLMNVSQKYLAHGLMDTGSSNLVYAILLDYRSLDTVGQMLVVFATVVGVSAILRKNGRTGQ